MENKITRTIPFTAESKTMKRLEIALIKIYVRSLYWKLWKESKGIQINGEICHISELEDSVWLGCHFSSNGPTHSMQCESKHQQVFCVKIAKV